MVPRGGGAVTGVVSPQGSPGSPRWSLGACAALIQGEQESRREGCRGRLGVEKGGRGREGGAPAKKAVS